MRTRVLLLLALVASTAAVTTQAVDPPRAVELHEADSPFVAFNIWIRSGSSADPAGKEGLAALTAALLASGSTQQDAYDGILQKLYPFAASYGAQTDKEMTVFTGRVHRDNLDAFYSLFKNAILSPAFREEDFNRVKAQRLNFVERARRYSRDEELSKDLLFWQAYQGTRYQHPEDGYVSSVRAITLDDVKSFYRDHYRRNGVVIGVAGGYPDGFVARVRRDFDALPDGATTAASAPAPQSPTGVRVVIVEKPTDASAVSLGYPISMLRSDPDFVPLMIANSYLGEHRNSVGRLYQAIRETRGINYGNYSYIEAFPAGYATQQPRVNVARRSQLLEIWIRPVSMTAPGNLHDRTLFATRAALYELRMLVQNGMTAQQVAGSKEFLRNYVATWGTTLSRRLGYAIDDAYYGIERPGFLASLRQAIDRTTPEQVNAAIRKYLRADNFHLVVITADAAAFRRKLLSGEATPITYAGERDADVLAQDKELARWPIPVKSEDVTVLPIDKVLE
jgi:zinc protease